MKISGSKRAETASSEAYADGADFCRIFKDDMDRLYLLSLLLAADPERAEKCFVRGLEESKSGNAVFKEWAHSWARRTIIISAIRMVRPRPGDAPAAPGTGASLGQGEGLPADCAAVLGLKTFDRFVFVISVLEGYSERDCRLLLDCSSSEIAEARVRAFEQLGHLAHQRSKTPNPSALLHPENLHSAPSEITGRVAASA